MLRGIVFALLLSGGAHAETTHGPTKVRPPGLRSSDPAVAAVPCLRLLVELKERVATDFLDLRAPVEKVIGDGNHSAYGTSFTQTALGSSREAVSWFSDDVAAAPGNTLRAIGSVGEEHGKLFTLLYTLNEKYKLKTSVAELPNVDWCEILEKTYRARNKILSDLKAAITTAKLQTKTLDEVNAASLEVAIETALTATAVGGLMTRIGLQIAARKMIAKKAFEQEAAKRASTEAAETLLRQRAEQIAGYYRQFPNLESKVTNFARSIHFPKDGAMGPQMDRFARYLASEFGIPYALALSMCWAKVATK